MADGGVFSTDIFSVDADTPKDKTNDIVKNKVFIILHSYFWVNHTLRRIKILDSSKL